MGIILAILVTSCGPDKHDWKKPYKQYSELCNCKNSKSQTIDSALEELMKFSGTNSTDADQKAKFVNGHIEAFVDLIDTSFLNDREYILQYNAVLDSVKKHHAEIDFKGNFNSLFAIRSKYSGCLQALPYISAH